MNRFLSKITALLSTTLMLVVGSVVFISAPANAGPNNNPAPPPPPANVSPKNDFGDEETVITQPKTSDPKNNDSPDPWKPNDPKGGGGSNGGGGGSSGTKWVYHTNVIDFRGPDVNNWADNQARSRCAASETVVGASVRSRIQYDPATDALVIGTSQLIGVDCLTLSFREYNVTCFTRGDITIDQVVPNSRNVVPTRQATTPWYGDKSLAACNASNSLTVGLYADITDYGRYQSHLRVYYQNALVREWGRDPITGETKAPEIRSIGGEGQYTNRYNYFQLTCVGATTSRDQGTAWHGTWSWTQTDCGPENNRNPVRYECTAKGTPLLNGLPAPTATITHSGDPNPLSWDVPTVVGNTSGPVTTQATKVDRAGTPWRSSAPANANDVELWRYGSNKLVNAEGTGWMSGIANSGWEFRSTWASENGKPTVLTPSFRYNANWVTEIIAITSVDIITGDLNVVTRTSTVNADAICTGAPISITVARTVNS